MSRSAWKIIKQTKQFYVSAYRRSGSIIIVLVIINTLLSFGVGYTYFNKPERAYYATYGETPPVELTGMGSANDTSVPLLADETIIDSDVRNLPQ